MKTLLLLITLLTSAFSYAQTSFGITSSLQNSDNLIGVIIPVVNRITITPVVGFNYNLNTNDHVESFGLNAQIDLNSNRLVPYIGLKYLYNTELFSLFGTAFGGEFYFTENISCNIELNIFTYDNNISTGTTAGVSYYFTKNKNDGLQETK